MKLFNSFLLIIALSLVSFKPVWSQNETDNRLVQIEREDNTSQIHNRRLWLVGAGQVAAFSGSLLFLNELWYKHYPRSSFHFHNDLPDWKQMDKFGHIVSAYHFSKLSHYTFRWAGLDNNQSALWGSISGTMFLTSIEILDGFSAEWGASLSDMAANTIGSLGFYVQQRAWKEQRIVWKYSYSESGITHYRPDLLGYNLGQKLIKDYNGLTLWLSFNINSLAGGNSIFPKWLNIAAGHSAMGLLGSRENPAEYNGLIIPEMPRYRQFYLAPDIDFLRIPVSSPTLKTIFRTLNFLKFPAPALEYSNEKGFAFHLLFF